LRLARLIAKPHTPMLTHAPRSACQVVPDIATFAVDDGFSYLVPNDVDVVVGSRVRTRVSGRRVKGFVTALFESRSDRKLIPIDGLSGDMPSFNPTMLESLRWASTHYVTPLSVLLKRTIPPNIPRSDSTRPDAVIEPTAQQAEQHHTTYRVGSPPYGPEIAVTIAQAARSGSVVVVAPTVVEIQDIATTLTQEYGSRVVTATSSMSGSELTRAWESLVEGGNIILVGTREVMFWPLWTATLVVIVEDGRRVMRSPGTPTLSVRQVMLHRSGVEGFSIVFHGPVPTLETVAQGVAFESPPGRQWPPVEIADRTEDPPGGGLFTERAKAAIRRATKDGGRTFVLANSRGYAPAFRCVACGDLRRCSSCGSAASTDSRCRRCGTALEACPQCSGDKFRPLGAGIGRITDDLRRMVGSEVGPVEENKLVTVGSERDLIGIHDVRLAIAIDVDGITMAPHYRAAEDALRLLARLAQTVERGGTGRCLLQTSVADQHVVRTLDTGRSEDFLQEELAARRAHSFPPVGSLIALETDNEDETSRLLSEHLSDHATVLGPAPIQDRFRWLIQGRDLTDARIVLRPVLTTLRGSGARVRVDVDPIDL